MTFVIPLETDLQRAILCRGSDRVARALRVAHDLALDSIVDGAQGLPHDVAEAIRADLLSAIKSVAPVDEYTLPRAQDDEYTLPANDRTGLPLPPTTVEDALAVTPPFCYLPSDVLSTITPTLTPTSHQPGTAVITALTPAAALVLDGQLTVRRPGCAPVTVPRGCVACAEALLAPRTPAPPARPEALAADGPVVAVVIPRRIFRQALLDANVARQRALERVVGGALGLDEVDAAAVAGDARCTLQVRLPGENIVEKDARGAVSVSGEWVTDGTAEEVSRWLMVPNSVWRDIVEPAKDI